MSSELKLLVVSEDESQAQEIRMLVNSKFPLNGYIRSSEVRREISRIQPNIVLLYEQKDGTGIQLIPYISREVPEAIIVYLTERRDPIRTRDVSRAGAFDILFLPDEINALEDILNRAAKVLLEKNTRNEVASSFSWGRGQIYTFYSGKGGSGKSLVAATLAQTLQLESTSGVLLVDLNHQYGGLETYLNIENDRNLYDLTPVLNELNDNHIRSVTTIEPYSQIEVLVSPADAEIAELITEDHIERLLRTARLYYDYILVDLPTEMNNLSYTALEEADRIIYVMNPESISLRIFSRTLDLFDKLDIDPTDRLEILINKISKDNELTPRDISQHFSYPIIGELRDDTKKIQQLLNRGQTLRTTRKERNLTNFAKDVQKLAKMILVQQAGKSAS
ncbi:AAA family ATPase [Lihuaxuella thermophila]|uniref:Pilus assembly protein CpaE n=1 Tax=Lihuaxuella thermophila TaxID=1173111 RepID=A0A1H8I4J0_9BACL|nr:AAA family ATPase [Lihuaxuella thermophila]SEN63241.1 pilus assembly protein CpaE [Lihuaxuella thermophila]